MHSWAGCSEMYKEPHWKWEEDLLTCSSVMEIVGKFFILSLSAGGGPVFSNWFNNYKWKTDMLTMTSCDQIRMTTRPIKSKETSLHISICLITGASLGSCKRAFFDSRHTKKRKILIWTFSFFFDSTPTVTVIFRVNLEIPVLTRPSCWGSLILMGTGSMKAMTQGPNHKFQWMSPQCPSLKAAYQVRNVTWTWKLQEG